MPINWNTALKYANLVKIAEGVKPNEDYSQPDFDEIKEVGYTFLQTIYGDELATDIDSHLGQVRTFGFIALNDMGEIVVVIRGTDTILEWIHDAEFLMVPSPIQNVKCLTDDGFTAVYKSLRVSKEDDTSSIRDTIQKCLEYSPEDTVAICGHSLGGALATMLTLDVALNTSCKSPTCYTFASPRVGDHLFSDKFNKTISNSFRVANKDDLVPKLPTILPLPYEHVANLYELKPGPELFGSVPCEHHLTTYLYLMSKLVGSSAYSLNLECQAKK